MWHYSNAQRFRLPVQGSPPGLQSTLDVLLGMRGLPVTFLLPREDASSEPANMLPGLLEAVGPGGLTIGLAAPLPACQGAVRFGVEVLAGPGVVRFITGFRSPVAPGDTQVSLMLPKQLETVQRRTFTRVRTTFVVVFAPAAMQSVAGPEPSGQGTVLDLGAGGLRLGTAVQLRPGQLLFLSFLAPDGTSYRGLEGTVVRTQAESSRTMAAIVFTSLEPDVEASLVQTVFRLQLGSPARR